MIFTFDDSDDFHYEELDTWEEAENFARQNHMELLGEHVCTEGETKQ